MRLCGLFSLFIYWFLSRSTQKVTDGLAEISRGGETWPDLEVIRL